MRYKWNNSSILGKDLPHVCQQYGIIVDCNGVEIFPKRELEADSGIIYLDEGSGIVEKLNWANNVINVTTINADAFRIPLKFIPVGNRELEGKHDPHQTY